MNGFKRVLQYADEHRQRLSLAVAYIVSSVIISILPYYFLYRLLIAFIEKNNVSVMLILQYAIAIGISFYLKEWLLSRGLNASHKVAYDTLMEMRKAFASKMLKLPMGKITQQGVGAYKKNFVDDIEQIESLLAHIVPEGISYMISPIIIFTAIFIIDWRLGFLSLGSIPIGFIALTITMVKGTEKMKKYYEAESNMNKTIVEYVEGMEVIKIFNRTTSSFEKYVKNIENYRDFSIGWYRLNWTYMAIYTSVLPCTILFMLPIGSIFYLNGTLQLSSLLLALLLALTAGFPLVKLMDFMYNIRILSHRVNELEKTFEGDELHIEDRGEIPSSYDVVYKNVTFAYNDTPVTKDVSFTAPSNAVTAIVGESGSGKSTLAKLLVHYWDVNDGSISIGDVNIKNMSMDRLMHLVSYVSQDVYLFDIPIIENIRIGKPDATDEEVMQAAKLAQCDEFVNTLKDGYYTCPGQSGDKLSGGERQRITIARAILKDSPIIVLDEATSSTDAESEDLIQEAINQLIQGKTLIVIAHHLSTVVGAEQIVLLEEGTVSAIGTHEALLEHSNKYQQLWEAYIQSSQWDIRVEEKKYA